MSSHTICSAPAIIMGHLATLAKETQVDRWPSITALQQVMMINAGCSRASFPGGMAAVELGNMACIPGFQSLFGGSTIRSIN